MPGRHVTDQQMRLFMTFRQTQPVAVAVAAAKTGFSQATGYRLQANPTLPSQRRLRGAGPALTRFRIFSTAKCSLY